MLVLSPLEIFKQMFLSRYAKLMKSLLNETFGYLIDTMQYDQSQYPGPPLSVPVEEVKHLFGNLKTPSTTSTAHVLTIFFVLLR
jgi:hypothetical protein